MIENIKAVNNPLTIIAIFAALAEIAGTVALKLVAPELQVIFIWFVMLFPILLVLLFFLTLNYNPKVLYAPSDFRNEENFLSTIRGGKELSTNFQEINEQLEVAKNKIVDEALKEIGEAGQTERTKLAEVVRRQIELVREKVETTRDSVENLSSAIMSVNYIENKKLLDIHFFDGYTCSYFNVTPIILEELKASKNMQEFFDNHVKDKYRYQILRWPQR
jgi:hypothetical protein